MELTPQQLRETADAIDAYNAGRPVEYQLTDGTWNDVVRLPPKDWTFNYGLGYRPKFIPPWKLPDPPKGQQWCSTNFLERELIGGFRPLLDGEVIERDVDEVSVGSWEPAKGYAGSKAGTSISRVRTRRALPPSPRPWRSPEDVPGPVCWLRHGNSGTIRLIVGIDTRGVCDSQRGEETWDTLRGCEYSITPQIKDSWKPCAIVE